MTSVDFSKGLVPTIILDDQNGDVFNARLYERRKLSKNP